MSRSSILLVYTGGTIGMKTDPQTGSLYAFDFNDLYNEFPYLKILPVNIEFMKFPPIDSSNVTVELWQQLAALIKDNYDRFDGFVILHGTDTMAYSSSALSFMLENLSKPVVFTGSQLPIGVLRTDGRENLITAIEIAAARNKDRAMVPEVCVYFQNKLFRANRCTKYSVEQLSAFTSENYAALAEVGVNINYNTHAILDADPSADLAISTNMVGNIATIRLFPGMSPHVLSSILSTEGLDAVVLETFGAGNAPTADWFIGAIKDAVDRGVLVVNVSQCRRGSVSMGMYDAGLQLQRAGVISCRDMTLEATVTKLMYLFGLGLTTDQVAVKLGQSIRGEITI